MKKLFLLCCLCLWVGHAEACNVPNPNLKAPPFVDGCDIPAVALNRLAGLNVSVGNFGAVGNGTTDDTSSIQAAINSLASAGGGNILMPPTGGAYVIASTIAVPAGVHVIGTGGLNWANNFFDNVETDWTNKNTWVKCTSLVAVACFDVVGSGADVIGINFWYTQPTPANAFQCSSPCTFTSGLIPNQYPWAIKVEPPAQFNRIENINIVNGWNCIDWEGPSSGIMGQASTMKHVWLGCMGTGDRYFKIDNTMDLSDIHHQMFWYQGSSDWWNVLENGSAIGSDFEYLANPILTDVEYSFIGKAMKLTNQTVATGFNTSGALLNVHGTGISFNEVCQAMTVASSTVLATGTFEGVTVAGDTTTSGVTGQCMNVANNLPGSVMFNLASDDVNFTLSDVIGGDLQQFAFIGGGNVGTIHGQLHLHNINTQQYSWDRAGGVAIQTDATGSIVDVTGNLYLYPSGVFTAGALCSGGGCFAESQINLGNTEITAPAGTASQTCLTNLPTPPGTPGTMFLGTQVFCLRKDTSGNFEVDRYVSGSFDESPIQIAGTSHAPVKFPEPIGMQTGFTDVPILISALPSCTAGLAGKHLTVSNGVASPTYGATVSATGAVTDPVFCNGSNWVYQ